MPTGLRERFQEEVRRRIARFIGSEERALLVAGPPGIGKTHAVIRAVYEEYPGKVYVVLRTHTQQDHYAKIVPREDYIAIRGIQEHCRVREVRNHPLAHQLCKWMRERGCSCGYTEQFSEAGRRRVVSLLYSHLSTAMVSLLRGARIVVFDEYHSLLPQERRITYAQLRLAEEEYGRAIRLEARDVLGRLEEMRARGMEVWAERGYSYLLEVVSVLEQLKKSGSWLYRVEGGYGYLDIAGYELTLKLPCKKIFVSATPLPRMPGLMEYDSTVEASPTLPNVKVVIFTGIELPYRKRFDRRARRIVNELVRLLSMYRSVIFLPSEEAKRRLIPRPAPGVTEDVGEFAEDPGRSVLLIAGGRWAEGIDLPQPEVICIIGVPYDEPPFINPALRELYRYLRAKGLRSFTTLYRYRALSKTLQAIGRGLRKLDQRLLVILADRRYADECWREVAPKWFLVQRFRVVDDLRVLRDYLVRWGLGLGADEHLERVQRARLLKKIRGE